MKTVSSASLCKKGLKMKNHKYFFFAFKIHFYRDGGCHLKKKKMISKHTKSTHIVGGIAWIFLIEPNRAITHGITQMWIMVQNNNRASNLNNRILIACHNGAHHPFDICCTYNAIEYYVLSFSSPTTKNSPNSTDEYSVNANIRWIQLNSQHSFLHTSHTVVNFCQVGF